MSETISACIAVVGLCIVLVVIQRRNAGPRTAGPRSIPKPDPVPVDRPFDPALCAFCDEPGRPSCAACGRSLCAEHRPWPAERFCAPCETRWDRGARRRALVIAPLVIGAMFVTCMSVGGVVLMFAAVTHSTGGAGMIAAFIVPLAIATPVYLKIERRMRRGFRVGTGLPSATLRAR